MKKFKLIRKELRLAYLYIKIGNFWHSHKTLEGYPFKNLIIRVLANI